MDILNFISWIRGGRKVDTIDLSQTLIPVGIRDDRRDDQYLTVAITAEDFAAQIAPQIAYKVYSVLLTQNGTNPPVAIVLENTLGLDPIYYYEYAGGYRLEDMSGLFTVDKTFVLATGTGGGGISVNINNANTIELNSINMNQPGGGLQDGMLYNAALEIRVYN